MQVRIELYDRKQTKFISAHNTPLVCLTLSMDGKRLATASDKGTLVRVWNTADGALLQVREEGMCVLCDRLGAWGGGIGAQEEQQCCWCCGILALRPTVSATICRHRCA